MKSDNENHFQNKFENIFQKFTQNKNLKKHFQILSSQLQDTENDAVSISEFIFIQTSTVNSQILINYSQSHAKDGVK